MPTQERRTRGIAGSLGALSISACLAGGSVNHPGRSVPVVETNSETSAVSDSSSTSFATLEGLEGWTTEDRTRISGAASLAVRSTGLPATECRVTYIESYFWDDIDLFRIEHGSCWSLTIRVVAVDRNGKSHLLTGDLTRILEESEVTSSAAEALASFNLLTSAEDVRIGDEADAKEYLEFFLGVFLQRSGSYIPTSDLADMVRGLRPNSPKSELLRDGLKQIEKPVVEVLSNDDMTFRARSYNWYWWSGLIKRFDLEIDANGRVAFQETDSWQQD